MSPDDDALMQVITGGLDRPAFIERGGTAGRENIDPNEVKLPRLAIAQGLSPEMLPDSSSYIDGLKLGDLFDSLTGEIFSRGPLTFIPAQRDVRRIELRPRSEGAGIIDLNVPVGDPRLMWTDDPDNPGKRLPPRATKFVEFIVMLFRPKMEPRPIVLSIKLTNKFMTRAADRLTGFIELRNCDIHAGVYTVASKMEKNDKGSFGVYVINNAGFVQDPKVFDFMTKFRENLAGKTIVVDRDEHSEVEADAGADTFDVDRETDELRD